MKRINLIIILVLCALFIFAQDDSVPNLEWKKTGDLQFSAHIGLTTSSLRDVDGPITILFRTSGDRSNEIIDSGTGFLIAGRMEYFLGQNWSIRSGLGYEQRDYGGGSLDYINVPLYPTWHFGKNRRWHLGLGAAYAIALESVPGFESNVNIITNIGIIIPISDLRFYIEVEGSRDIKNIEFITTDINGNPVRFSSVSKSRSSINFGFYF